MTMQPFSENPENTHQAVLFHLKRNNEMTVAELCEALDITSMAVRRHLLGLQQDGLVECRLVKQSRGRPTYRYRLTAKAEGLFPSALPNMAFDLLDAVFEQKGHKGVTELLSMRDEWLARKLAPRLSTMTIEDRVSEVSKFFSENGYMTEWEKLGDGNFFIYQRHCAIHHLAQQYRQLCLLEAKLIEKLIGVKVTREKYMLKNDPVCGYLVRTEEAVSVV